jgi:HSP20 family protein
MPRRGVDEWFWSIGDLQRLSEELVRSRPVVASGTSWEPRVDVMEDARRFTLKAEIAGVRGEDIQLLYIPDRHSVLIRGIRREEETSPGRTSCHQLEIFYGEFSREIKLPDVPIDAQGMRAQYRNGFLLVMIPKAESVVVTKTITIKGV